MPRPGLIWRHVILSTYGTWLHGDPRGFRSRGHRLHSSGDYRQPPSPGEHAGLHEHQSRHAGPRVVIPVGLRSALGGALLEAFRTRDIRVLAVAVCATHVHLLAELSVDPDAAKTIMGQCKGAASAMVRDVLPGRIWAAGATLKPVRDQAHQRQVHRYILEQQDEAWTWSFGDAET